MTTNITSLNNTKPEPFFERHAWKMILLVSLVILLFGLGDMIGGASDLQKGETVFMHSITGMSWNALKAESPRIANLIDVKFRMDGTALTTLALLSIGICLTGFRKGERWVWITLWVLPFWSFLTAFFLFSVDKISGSGIPIPVYSGTVIGLIFVLLLGLTYRKFFRS